MSYGPGKYDDLCTFCREHAQARGAILLIIDGNKGEGFSAQTTPDILVRLPQILRVVADQLSQDLLQTQYKEYQNDPETIHTTTILQPPKPLD